MTSDGVFIASLNAKREQLEQDFDNVIPPSAYAGDLELLNDLVFSLCTETDRPSGGEPEKLAYLGLAIQNLWAAVNIARIGLYSPSQANLRCAMEHGLRWDVARSATGFQEPADRRGPAWERKPDALDPRTLRTEAEPSLWLWEGLSALYSVLTGDVHLHVGTLDPSVQMAPLSYSRLFKIAVPDDPANPARLSFPLFGSHALPDPAANAIAFLALWRRLCSRIASGSTEDRTLKELTESTYPLPPDLAVPFDAAQLANQMWKHERTASGKMKIGLLDLQNGSIAEEEFPVEDPDTVLALQLPICRRDPLVSAWRASGRVPVPKCGLRVKGEIARRFVQSNASQLHVKGAFCAEVERELRQGRFSAQVEREVAADPAWVSYRDGCLLEWPGTFGLRRQHQLDGSSSSHLACLRAQRIRISDGRKEHQEVPRGDGWPRLDTETLSPGRAGYEAPKRRWQDRRISPMVGHLLEDRPMETTGDQGDGVKRIGNIDFTIQYVQSDDPRLSHEARVEALAAVLFAEWKRQQSEGGLAAAKPPAPPTAGDQSP